MTKAELKQRVYEAIERRGADIIRIGETIRRHPELGFKEVKTAALVTETLRGLGLAPKTGLALTGVRADVEGGQGAGPTFALLGELDALVVSGHPQADPATGAAHACGHNAQVAGMLGAAMGLIESKAIEQLTGKVIRNGSDVQQIVSFVGQARRPQATHGLEPRALAVDLHPEVRVVRGDVQRERLAGPHARMTRIALDHGQPSRSRRM